MEIQITSRHNKASQALQDTITTELQRMEKFIDKITSCHVILDSEHVDKTVEITLSAPGHQVVASAKADNLGKAIDEALSKTERQLKKLNEKIKNHKTTVPDMVVPDMIPELDQ
ncbi:MAG: ribosome-associated translation inhibitor RaiA [Chitinispirillaceae bacterium]|nr:ribosome-associated translation inhibitor RaiA [Chitinispirillaceae bacterium]